MFNTNPKPSTLIIHLWAISNVIEQYTFRMSHFMIWVETHVRTAMMILIHLFNSHVNMQDY